MIDFLIAQISIWLPSLVSIIGVVAAIIPAIKKAKDALEEFKQDKTMKALQNELRESINQNTEIKQQYDIIIDELKKVKDYRENGGK